MSNKLIPKEHVEDIANRLYGIIEKHYKCTHHREPSFSDPHGCTDCYNKGVIIDDELGGELMLLEKHIENVLQVYKSKEN